ncbi:hypothetical protein RHO12_12580 (plasmid) [Orbus sturtevantii]|uniref:hypothetical protein n=1 Tax=Orbus sturtevantii TaxID=3074109 RepID=UPI00370D9B56
MKELNLLQEIIRDVDAANRLRDNISWKNWESADVILESYQFKPTNVLKSILERAIKTDGLSLEKDISRFKKFS